MVYLTLCKKNNTQITLSKNDDAVDLVSDKGRFSVNDVEIPKLDEKFDIVGTQTFDDEFSLSRALSVYQSKLKPNESRIFFIHPYTPISSGKTIQMVTLSIEKSASYKTVQNPFWAGARGVFRNREGLSFESDISLALQSQLYAMLDKKSADEKWMSEFLLKDIFVEDVYEWQRSALPSGNLISADKMMTIMKNVLNVVRLPWLKLRFVDQGKSCYFKVNFASAGKSDSNVFSWLHANAATEGNWERVGLTDRSPRIKIDSMELCFVTTWGMNPYILLHELSHYIAFCMPVKAKLNQGGRRFSFKEYEKMFGGHGIFFMGVFRCLLIMFGNVRKDWLDASLDSNKVKYLSVDRFNVADFEKAIDGYERY